MNDKKVKIINNNKNTDDIHIQIDSEFVQIFNALLPTYVVDTNYNIISVNDKFLYLFGLKKEEFVGQKCYSAWPGPMCKTSRCSLRQILGGIEDYEFEMEKAIQDGIKASFIVKVSPYRKFDGKIVGAIKSFVDITERNKAEQLIKQKLDFKKFVSNISSRFVKITNLDIAINASLREIGKMSEASQTYIFLFNKDNMTMNNTHEWCAEGIAPQMNNLQDLHLDMFPWLIEKINKNKFIQINDISKLPAKASAEKKLLENQGVKSLLVFPLTIRGEISGFIGFNKIRITKTLNEHDFSLLRISSEIIGNAFERRIVDKKLKESEQKYRFIFENTPFSVVIFNSDGIVVDCNPTTEKMLGYEKKELIGRHFENVSIIHPKYSPIFFKLFNNFLKGEQLNHLDLQLYKKDNNLIWANLLLSLVKIRDRTFVQGIFRDITEKKEAEEKLRESEQKYRDIIEKNYDGYFEVDLKGNFTFINKRISDYLGYSKEELIGMNFRKVINARDINRVIKKYNLLYQNKLPHIIHEHEVIIKDGQKKLVENAVYLKCNSKGEKVGFYGLTRDINVRKELKESEERYRHLFESSPYSIILFNLEGYIINCNSTTEELFGFKKEELIGKNYTILPNFTSKTFSILGKGSKIISRGLIEESKEMIAHNKFGNLIWINIQLSLVNLDKEVFIQAIIQNITQRKNFENLIYEQNKQLSEINKLKSELMRKASHELKTPLVSVKGYTDLLLNVYKDQFNEDVLSNIGEIKQGCERLEKIIKDILKSSKLDSNQLKLRLKKENLTFLIRYCVKNHKMLLLLRNQKITLELHEKLICNIEKERIYEVISNLLTNAIKYSPKKTEIIIKSEIKDNLIVISIKDHGIGFTEEDKKKIFKEFGKIKYYEQNLDIESRGTGLGLYIAKRIVKLHGGSLWMESKGRNKGSTFYFTLPIVKENS
ncbi:MAG: PAS domain S-box protein [Promethearchaeota archaeon]